MLPGTHSVFVDGKQYLGKTDYESVSTPGGTWQFGIQIRPSDYTVHMEIFPPSHKMSAGEARDLNHQAYVVRELVMQEMAAFAGEHIDSKLIERLKFITEETIVSFVRGGHYYASPMYRWLNDNNG